MAKIRIIKSKESPRREASQGRAVVAKVSAGVSLAVMAGLGTMACLLSLDAPRTPPQSAAARFVRISSSGAADKAETRLAIPVASIGQPQAQAKDAVAAAPEIGKSVPDNKPAVPLEEKPPAAQQGGASQPEIAAGAVRVALPPATPPNGSPPAKDKKNVPAKELFGAVLAPAQMAARSIGFYAKGCLAGAKPLPVNGPAWQAMRLSRNRNWGHPSLVKFIEQFAKDAKEKDGWPGLLVGDMSQPRGGPLPFGHASHQVGLDVDIWYRAMPDHELTRSERDDIPMESILSDPTHVNPQVWNPSYEKLLRRAASYPQVARIFVHPAIKKALCEGAGKDRAFLHKIQAIWGHDDHFHVRLVCPPGQEGCRNQPPLPSDEGCGKGLDKWLKLLARPAPAPAPPPKTAVVKKWRSKPPLTLAQLPPECRTVLSAAPSNPVEPVAEHP